jgi:hypothetical protein
MTISSFSGKANVASFLYFSRLSQFLYQELLLGELEFALERRVDQELWNVCFRQQITQLQSLSRDRKVCFNFSPFLLASVACSVYIVCSSLSILTPNSADVPSCFRSRDFNVREMCVQNVGLNSISLHSRSWLKWPQITDVNVPWNSSGMRQWQWRLLMNFVTTCIRCHRNMEHHLPSFLGVSLKLLRSSNFLAITNCSFVCSDFETRKKVAKSGFS